MAGAQGAGGAGCKGIIPLSSSRPQPSSCAGLVWRALTGSSQGSAICGRRERGCSPRGCAHSSARLPPREERARPAVSVLRDCAMTGSTDDSLAAIASRRETKSAGGRQTRSGNGGWGARLTGSDGVRLSPAAPPAHAAPAGHQGQGPAPGVRQGGQGTDFSSPVQCFARPIALRCHRPALHRGVRPGARAACSGWKVQEWPDSAAISPIRSARRSSCSKQRETRQGSWGRGEAERRAGGRPAKRTRTRKGGKCARKPSQPTRRRR